MLCGKCSEAIKPVVAIDIDGTLGNYHGHFLRFAEQYMGHGPLFDVGLPLYDGTVPMREWFCTSYGCDVSTFRAIKLAYRQGGMKRSMPAFPHAPALTSGLRQAGAEVWLTTTRPWQRYDRIDPDTHEWLRRNEIEFDAVLYDEHKYTRLAERVDPARVVGVLDDEPEQYDNAVAQGWCALLRVNQYNRNVRRSIMAEGLGEALIMLTGHVKRWERRHA